MNSQLEKIYGANQADKYEGKWSECNCYIYHLESKSLGSVDIMGRSCGFCYRYDVRWSMKQGFVVTSDFGRQELGLEVS